MLLSRYCPWQDHLFDLEEEEEALGLGLRGSGFRGSGVEGFKGSGVQSFRGLGLGGLGGLGFV